MIDIKYAPGWQGEKVTRMVEKAGVPYLVFEPLERLSFIKHGFSTRLGGVSENEFASMNLSYERGDKKEAVDENYHRICRAMKVEEEQLVFSQQVHKTTVVRVEKPGKYLKETDGMVTNVPGLVLTTSYADCVPLFFADPVEKAIGLSHSGWRGTRGEIGRITVETMKKEFGSRPEHIVAVIGPSICSQCYEVSKEVADQFPESVKWKKGGSKDEKYQLDLWKANKEILEKAGLLPEHIYTAGVCTSCNSNLLFSHRASAGKRGNLNGFLSINIS